MALRFEIQECMNTVIIDKKGRKFRNLRVSLTAACNYACTYCVPDGKRLQKARNELSAEMLIQGVKYLIEVAGIKFTLDVKDGKLISKKISEYSSLVKPDMFIPEESTKIHNITNKMVEEAPGAKKVIGEFMRFCGLSTVLVAHNAAFDAEFLAKAVKKHGLMMPQNPVIDSLRITKKILVEAPSQRLGELAKKLHDQIKIQVDDENLHRALYDCEVLKEVFTVCLKKRFQVQELSMDKAVKSLEPVHGPPLKFSSYV